MGDLSCIDHDISHHEPSDEDGRPDDSRNPGIMFPHFYVFDVMGDQFIDLKGQGKEDAQPHNQASNFAYAFYPDIEFPSKSSIVGF